MPHIDKEALESLIWDADPGSSWADGLDLDSDDAAAKVADHVCRRLSTLRSSADMLMWFMVGVWIAAATAASLYGNSVAPADPWYEWPLLWLGSAGLVGIALTVVFGVTVFVHDFWWTRFGDGRRDAEFYDEPLTRRPGAGRIGGTRLLDTERELRTRNRS